jgi:PilZ domain
MNKPFEWKIGKSERFLTNLELRFVHREIQWNGMLKDLSSGGARIVSDAPVALHDQLNLVLMLHSQAAPLEVPCATVRWVLGGEFGVELFGEVDCKSFKRLVEYLSWLKEDSPLQPMTSSPGERKAA